MAPRWKDIAERNLEKGDNIAKNYPAEYEGHFGHILMSNRKLQFVSEEGFFKKNYELILELPYEKIKKVSRDGRYELDITDAEGKKHRFETRDITSSIPENALKELSK
jgi:hypothetical protein